MNALEVANALERRTRGTRDEVKCPLCQAWRPGFCVTELNAAEQLLHGAAWACDADRTKWARGASV